MRIGFGLDIVLRGGCGTCLTPWGRPSARCAPGIIRFNRQSGARCKRMQVRSSLVLVSWRERGYMVAFSRRCFPCQINRGATRNMINHNRSSRFPGYRVIKTFGSQACTLRSGFSHGHVSCTSDGNALISARRRRPNGGSTRRCSRPVTHFLSRLGCSGRCKLAQEIAAVSTRLQLQCTDGLRPTGDSHTRSFKIRRRISFIGSAHVRKPALRSWHNFARLFWRRKWLRH